MALEISPAALQELSRIGDQLQRIADAMERRSPVGKLQLVGEIRMDAATLSQMVVEYGLERDRKGMRQPYTPNDGSSRGIG